MKKFLSLMLAMIMVMSLVVVGAGAADFTDEEQIQYTDAVAVMSELGILGGYEDGSFRPQGTLTRQVAAKIIAYIALGVEDAEKLICVEDPFTDVAASKTLAPYVNWVAKKGIVSGYEDGTFGPGANVSGHAFLKMVLGALGIEGTYEGTGWRVNVTSAAAEAGLFEGIDTTAIDLRADATRELACQIAFNAMFYTAEASSYQVMSGDTVLATCDDKDTAELLMIMRDGDRIVQVKNKEATLAYTNFGLTATTPEEGGVDTYGRPATVYEIEDGETFYAPETPVLTYTNTKTEKALFTALGKAGYQGTDDKFVFIRQTYTDAQPGTAGTVEKLATGKYKPSSSGGRAIEKTDSTNSFGANGAIVEIYAVAGATNEFTAVITNEYLAKVTSVTKANEDQGNARHVTATVYDGGAATTASLTYETEEFAKNDYVLVTKKWNGEAYEIDSMKAATQKKDVALDAYKGSTNVTIDGKTVKYSAKFTTAINNYLGKGSFNFDDTYSYYVDSQGNILAITTYFAAVNNYVYVKSIQTQEYDASDLIGTGAEAKAVADVIFTDGTMGVIELKVTKATADAADGVSYVAGDYTYAKPAAGGTVATKKVADIDVADRGINNWFAYKTNDDGTYTLVALAASVAAGSTPRVTALDATDVTLVKGVANNIAENRWTTSSTVVYSIDTEGAVTKATGLVAAELDGEAVPNQILYTWNSSNNVTAIYAVEQAGIIEAIASDYVYALSAGSTVKDGIEWKFADEGAAKTYVISNAESFGDFNAYVKGEIFTLSEVDGKITAKKITANVEKQATVARIDDAYILFTLSDDSTTALYLTAETAVYNVVDGTVAVDELEKDDVVTLVYNSDNELVVAYITTEADA